MVHVLDKPAVVSVRSQASTLDLRPAPPIPSAPHPSTLSLTRCLLACVLACLLPPAAQAGSTKLLTQLLLYLMYYFKYFLPEETALGGSSYVVQEVQELADVLTRSVRNTSEAIAMDPLIEKCVIAESCTLAVTGTKTYLLQSWWSCYTCGARGKYGAPPRRRPH